MSSSGRFSPNEWVLPETAKLFEHQASRQRQLADSSDAMALHRKRRQRLVKSYESSSKLWLKKHGLVASRLTILDALAPTLVPHRSSYIPILDKHVLSRVFDEILPIAHVSGSQKNRVHLVNPSAVNLKEYEEKLEKALAKYRQRLDTVVWKALPESVKQEFDTEDPVPFSEHRGKFLQALSEEGWPVAEADIAALEQEIERGEKFLQQSKDLRRAAAEPASDALSDVSSMHRSLNNSAAASQMSRGTNLFASLHERLAQSDITIRNDLREPQTGNAPAPTDGANSRDVSEPEGVNNGQSQSEDAHTHSSQLGNADTAP